MHEEQLKKILEAVQAGDLSPQAAAEEISHQTDLPYANIDWNRKKRTGASEVVYCAGKTMDQIIGIAKKMLEHGEKNVLLTRLSVDNFSALKEKVPSCVYYETARIGVVNPHPFTRSDRRIAVVAAGTSDMPVAEEAAVTAEVLGNKVMRIYDVGVAGLHRLLARLEDIQKAHVIVCVAGMEGALASVVGGLVRVPVIAVPTSVGYGANFGGLSALLCMLNSCASGVGVVNIDNGFGAGYLASTINNNA